MININNLSFKYSPKSGFALKNINLSIAPSDFVLLAGPSGSGKSTLLNLILNKGKMPGFIAGDISIGTDGLVGYFSQNVESMIVCERVWQELAFALENQGKSRDYISRKVSELASFFNLNEIYHEKISDLSGGMKQKVLLAGIMSTDPEILLLDEPISMLDPIAASNFLALLKKINKEFGTTIIICEHRYNELLDQVDKVLVLEEGQLVFNDSPRALGGLAREDEGFYKMLPAYIKIASKCLPNGELPLSALETRKALFSEYKEKLSAGPFEYKSEEKMPGGQEVIGLKNITFAYQDKKKVLTDLDLSVSKGQVHYILGANGSGKSTLLSVIAGATSQGYYGKKEVKGSLSMLPQNPLASFSKDTLIDELNFYNSYLGKPSTSQEIIDLIKELRLENCLDIHPYDLSGGELMRAALAKLLIAKTDILLLDEPTKGLDSIFAEEFANILVKLKEQGKTIIVVSHDCELAAATADKISMIFDGKIVSTLSPYEFFTGNSFYTTDTIKTVKNIVKGAILPDEAIGALLGQGGINNKNTHDNQRGDRDGKKSKVEQKHETTNVERWREILKPAIKSSKQSERLFGCLFALVVLVFIPLVIYFGATKLDNNRYTFISLAILFLAMLPAYITFEKQERPVMELVLIATMAALAVVARVVFYMLPSFKPTLAIVVISGLSMGAFDGFMVGMLSMLVSNIFFMQGPWTPWQMLAMGLVGLVSGLLGKVKIFREKRLAISIFGALSCLFIYGLIINPASLFMVQEKISLGLIIATYATGLPMDLVHALASFIFLFILAKPVISKVDRAMSRY